MVARHIGAEVDDEMAEVVLLARSDGAVGQEHVRVRTNESANRVVRVDPGVASRRRIELGPWRAQFDRENVVLPECVGQARGHPPKYSGRPRGDEHEVLPVT